MKKFSRLLSAVTAICLAVGGMCIPQQKITTASAVSGYTVEKLDRGISAINTGSGMMVSWRYLADDSEDTIFKLYRNDTLIYTSNAGNATCFLDAQGKYSDSYKVETISGGKTVSTDTCKIKSDSNYLQVNLDVPKGSVAYTPNDCTVGDVDGDGQYELFVKWDPANSQDNSKGGKTDKVYIDCYKLDGTKLWRIDLGYNIRAGAHYTQMLVADFDLDGKAELTCKTADGTVDGQGNVIGDASKNYRNSKGYILSGPEFYTLFDGATGKALDTVDYNPPRGDVSKWGDKYGNRCDRFLGAVAYLDGNKPSAVTIRGYYTRMTACAYDVVNKKLVQRWYFDTGNDSSKAGYGDGNHNCMPADVDNDGKQEIVLGATCLDDDGSVLWCLETGHGDAMHLGDLLPDRKGLELWICHEDKPYGVSLVDASNGKTIFHKNGEGDTGRCCADNVWAGNKGAEFWGLGNDVFDGSGNTLSCRRPAVNFVSYWDGDLEREILDGYTDSPATITKMGDDGKLTKLLTTDGFYTCNTTKGTPCLSADIFGDWREELIVRSSDGKSIGIFSTPYTTDYRITTLMHDPQYRNQVAGQNISYNQPPHASFYLGSDYQLPEKPAVTVNNANGGTVTPPVIDDPVVAETLAEGAVFTIKNVNSGLYLEVAEGKAENASNVQQWGAESPASHNTWRAISAGNGYYYLYSQLGDKVTYLLDLDKGLKDDGTNIQIYTDTKADAQQFKFVKNSDGYYNILTKSSNDKSCIAVASASTSNGANIIEWTLSKNDTSQQWILEQTEDTGCELDTGKTYMFKNAESGLYMDVAGGSASDNTNVQQWGADKSGKQNSWTLKNFGGGYYYIISQVGDGKTFYLNMSDKAIGGNAEILTNNKTSSHLFKFVKNPDGTYYILSRSSKDAYGLEADGTGNGANIQQGIISNKPAQKWILESVTYAAGDIDKDGSVSKKDFIFIHKHILQLNSLTAEQLAQADIIADNNINVFDAVALKQKLM